MLCVSGFSRGMGMAVASQESHVVSSTCYNIICNVLSLVAFFLSYSQLSFTLWVQVRECCAGIDLRMFGLYEHELPDAIGVSALKLSSTQRRSVAGVFSFLERTFFYEPQPYHPIIECVLFVCVCRHVRVVGRHLGDRNGTVCLEKFPIRLSHFVRFK